MTVAFLWFFGSKTQQQVTERLKYLFLGNCLPSFVVHFPGAMEELHLKLWFLSFLSLNTLFITIFLASWIYESISFSIKAFSILV